MKRKQLSINQISITSQIHNVAFPCAYFYETNINQFRVCLMILYVLILIYSFNLNPFYYNRKSINQNKTKHARRHGGDSFLYVVVVVFIKLFCTNTIYI